MLHCGLLCRGCGLKCSDPPTERNPIELQCIYCDGGGCNRCNNGYVDVKQCPRMEVGTRFAQEIRMVTHAMHDKLLPDSGGINDQPSRFVHLWQAFRGDVSVIEQEEAKRK